MGVKVREKPPGSGVWWIFVNHNGRRKSKKVGSEEAALEAARKIEARLTLGEFDMDEEKPEPKVQTFKEYAELWLHGHIKPFRRDTTFERYGDMLKRFAYPKIGKIPMDQIKRKHIREMLLEVNRQGLSRSTVALVKDVVSGPFGMAVDDEIVQSNPTTGILRRMNLSRRKQAPRDVLNQEEVDLFLATCREHERPYYSMFLTAFRTGLRLGELVGLMWEDIDWNGRFIRVRRAVRRGVVGGTKTGRERSVDMTDQLFQELEALQKQRRREGIKAGTGLVPYLFHRRGEPLSQNSVRNVFKRVLDKAKLRRVRIHDIRHSYASLLLSAGVSPVYVKEQLGHTNISMTVDIYGHWIRSTDRGAVNYLDGSEAHPAAPYTHPAEKAKAQPHEIAP